MARFNGLGMSLGNLARLSSAKTRSISPENFSGTSVPYDAGGPGWNDFQLQGR